MAAAAAAATIGDSSRFDRHPGVTSDVPHEVHSCLQLPAARGPVWRQQASKLRDLEVLNPGHLPTH